jgi:hypothetical protein
LNRIFYYTIEWLDEAEALFFQPGCKETLKYLLQAQSQSTPLPKPHYLPTTLSPPPPQAPPPTPFLTSSPCLQLYNGEKPPLQMAVHTTTTH